MHPNTSGGRSLTALRRETFWHVGVHVLTGVVVRRGVEVSVDFVGEILTGLVEGVEAALPKGLKPVLKYARDLGSATPEKLEERLEAVEKTESCRENVDEDEDAEVMEDMDELVRKGLRTSYCVEVTGEVFQAGGE